MSFPRTTPRPKSTPRKVCRRRRRTNHKGGGAWMVCLAAGGVLVHPPTRNASAAFAQAAGFERDHRAACGAVGHFLGDLLGDAEQPLAAIHFLPDIFGADAGGDPEDDQIVEEIGAFLDHSVAIAVHRVDDYLDR